MKIFKRRKYLLTIQDQLKDLDTILFLVWARQVGKTTILKSLFEFWYIDKNKSLWLDGEKLFELWIASFNDFVWYIQTQCNIEKLSYLIIDEAQFVENIGIILKVLIDSVRRGDYKFKVIVSGSGSLNIFKWMSDSLVWRKHILQIYPFSWEEFLEFKKNQNIYWLDLRRVNLYKPFFLEYIKFGGYPAVVMEKDVEKKFVMFDNLIKDYLLKDVSVFLKENELLKFKQFLKLVSLNIWNVLNISYFQNNLGFKRLQIEKFFFLMENTFFVNKLEWFVGGKISRETKKYFKLYFNDVGILNYFLQNLDFEMLKWKLVENFVFSQLLTLKKAYQQIYFYRTWSGSEIDFILKDDLYNFIIPIEVKTWNKDNLWKWYISFLKAYNQNIKAWYLITENLIKWRQEEGIDIRFIPYILLHNIFTGLMDEFRWLGL